MATETLRAVLTAVWQGGQATAKAADDIDRVGGTTEKTKSHLQNLKEGMKTAGEAFGLVAGGAKLAWSTLERGAALELASTRFDTLATSINTTSDALLTNLRSATRGMITDAELMQSATQIISLGLMDTEDGVVRLARVVGELGWDMNQVILTFANNSKMRLDALGLSIEDVDARTQALVETGMNIDEAFDLAVLEAGEARLELLGSAADSTAGAMQRLKTMVSNLINTRLEKWAADAGPVFQAMAGVYAGDIQAMIDAQLSAVQSTEDLIEVGQKLSNVTGFQAWFTGTLDVIEESEADIVRRLALMSDGLGDFQNNLQATFGDMYVSELDFHTAAVGETAAVYVEMTAASEMAATATYEMRRAGIEVASTVDGPVASAFDAATTAVEEYTSTAVAAADEIYEMRREGIDSSEALRAKIVRDYEEQKAATEELEAATKKLAQAHAGEFLGALEDSDEETRNFTTAMLESAAQAGANEAALFALALATGDYTEAQIEAALKTAAMTIKAQELGVAIAEGTITVEDAVAELMNFQERADQGVEIYVKSDEVVEAQQRALSAKLAMEDLDGTHANVTVTTHFTQVGSPYTGPYDTYAPEYAAGTAGWETVPGPTGMPFPVVLHGGEQFNVVPSSRAPTQSEAQPSNNYNINLIVDGVPQAIQGGQARAEPLLKAARDLGVPV